MKTVVGAEFIIEDTAVVESRAKRTVEDVVGDVVGDVVKDVVGDEISTKTSSAYDILHRFI